MSDSRAQLLDQIVAERPDAEAWAALVLSCQEEHGRNADLALCAYLGRRLGELSGERREAVAPAVAEIVPSARREALALLLASGEEESARHLALELIGLLGGNISPSVIASLRGLFLDRRLPENAQLKAAAALVRSIAADAPETDGLLRTLVSGLSKVQKIERLRKLAERVGSCPLLDALCEQFEDRLRMACPRCDIEMRRPEMLRHLWEKHRLLLIGRRVREPWSLIEEWLDARNVGGPVDLLNRCRNLAQHMDNEQGLSKVNRMILSRGLEDPEARQFLLEEANEQHASLCPKCYLAIPLPRESPQWRLIRRRGRLAAHGYLVDVSERRMRTSLEVRTPARRLYLGNEPGNLWTFRGALFVFAGPLVLLALMCALGTVEWSGSALAPVVWFLGLALLVYGVVRWDLRDRPTPEVRALTYAWTILAPRLHEDQFVADDASFLAALAREEDGDELTEARAGVLPRLITYTEDALRRGTAATDHLAALYLRQIKDEAHRGINVEEEIAGLASRCFDGRLPLAFAECLLAGWRVEWWTAGRAARLRVLLCDRAFEAGFEVCTLLDAGQTAPTLGEILGVSAPKALAALRLLWSLRPSRPWEPCGPAQSVFELAADPGNESRLAEMPDLLFFQMDRNWPMAHLENGGETPFRVAVRVSVLQIQEERFNERPAAVRVKGRLDGSELIVGSKRFHSEGDLEGLAKRVEAWSWYLFTQFLPTLPEVLNWKPPQADALWRAWGAIQCPGCGQPLLPRVGEMAVVLGGAGQVIGAVEPS